ncbi:MAG: energy transducer TonB [Flavobacteriales bacterium]|nr:energy transducer TonB [Flavobacteriales bacterium]
MMIAIALILFSLLCIALGLGRTWSDETQGARNALVFIGRNQDYGAYRLRTEYGQRLGVAFATTVCALAAAVLALWGIAHLGASDITDKTLPPHVIVEFTDVFLPPIEPPAPKPENRSVILPPAKPTTTSGFIEVVDSAVTPLVPPVDTTDLAAGTGTGTNSVSNTDPSGSTGIGAAAGSGSMLGVDSVWKDFQVQERPVFPGGETALAAWVERHLDFPRDMSGRDVVYVQFTVGLDGTVEDVLAVKGKQPDCRNAAERTVQRMPRWKPARMNGHDVRCRLTLPIHFETR